jgi:hypothetical protein
MKSHLTGNSLKKMGNLRGRVNGFAEFFSNDLFPIGGKARERFDA